MDFALKNLTFILMKNRFVFALFLVYKFNFLIAQLDLKEIMKGNEFVGYLPENQRWSFDGSKIYFDANEDMQPGYSVYQYEIT